MLELLDHSLQHEQLLWGSHTITGVLSSLPGRIDMATESKREYMRNYMKGRMINPAFREEQARYKKQWRKDNRDLVRSILAAFRKNGCRLCAEKEPCCLEAHHLIDKDFTVGGSKSKYSATRVETELRKCVCLCSNCHKKVHAGIISKPPQAVG
jgi:hypothetical protein